MFGNTTLLLPTLSGLLWLGRDSSAAWVLLVYHFLVAFWGSVDFRANQPSCHNLWCHLLHSCHSSRWFCSILFPSLPVIHTATVSVSCPFGCPIHAACKCEIREYLQLRSFPKPEVCYAHQRILPVHHRDRACGICVLSLSGKIPPLNK